MSYGLSACSPSVAVKSLLAELLGPNFRQKFAFGGRSMTFFVKILLTRLYLNIDRSETFDLCMTLMGGTFPVM